VKLRNKKTGEIIDIYKGQVIIHYDSGRKTIKFKSIEELEDWEDYEEPKDGWYIECDGEVYSTDRLIDYDLNKLKEISNYFELREEAEKAVEKLKAWKRLKDKGMIKYAFHKEKTGIDLDFYTLTILAPRDKDSLDLLFGGEE
jgi:hypothetical protein